MADQDMTDIESQITARSLQFLGPKKMRGPDEHPVKRLVTACINDRSRPKGRPPTDVKRTYVRSLKTMIPDEMQTGSKTVMNRKTGEESERRTTSAKICILLLRAALN